MLRTKNKATQSILPGKIWEGSSTFQVAFPVLKIGDNMNLEVYLDLAYEDWCSVRKLGSSQSAIYRISPSTVKAVQERLKHNGGFDPGRADPLKNKPEQVKAWFYSEIRRTIQHSTENNQPADPTPQWQREILVMQNLKHVKAKVRKWHPKRDKAYRLYSNNCKPKEIAEILLLPVSRIENWIKDYRRLCNRPDRRWK